MSHSRIAPLPILAWLLVAWSAASGQSVRSTHSGLVYFFDGYVFIGEEQLQQKFGRFQEIAEGGVLRTELGRAEVLLTPGVFLRIDENSAIRMVSNSLSDTRVELLRGSAIIEISHEATNPRDTLIYKSWQVRAPEDSIARLDSEPAQLRVLSGSATVSAEGDSGLVSVRRGEVLPLASVLVAEPAAGPAEGAFNFWAMNRSSVVSEDNSIAAGIIDDPDKIDASGVALGAFSNFPQTGIPSMGISYPYGVSFWNPYQSWVNPYLSVSPYPIYPFGLFYQRLPGGTIFNPRPGYPVPIRTFTGSGGIGRPSGPLPPRPSPLPPLRIPSSTPPRPMTPRVIHR